MRASSSWPRSRSTTPSSCSPDAPPPSAPAGDARHADEAVHDLCRSLDGLPLAIELAAARTRTLSVEEITRRLDDRFDVLRDPTSRKPERRRALGATIRWSYDLLFPDDQRGLWALATFAGGAPLGAVEFVLDALGVCRPQRRSTSSAASPAAPSSSSNDDASAQRRYRLLDSIRAFALDAMTEAGRPEHRAGARTPAGTPTPPHRPPAACAAAVKPTTSRSPGPSAPTSTPRWRGLPPTTRRCALDIVNGFGWAWVVLGDSRGAQRMPTALAAAGDTRSGGRTGHGAAARLLAGGVDRRPRASPPPHRRRRRPRRRHRRRRPARPLLLLPRLRRVPRRRVRAGDASSPTEAPPSTAGCDRPGTKPPTRCSPPGRDLRRRRGAAPSTAASRSSTGSPRSTTHGCTCAATPCSASSPACSTASTTRSAHIARAAETSRRRGYLQTEAYQVASLGRAQCQAGDYAAGAATLATGRRQGGGDRRRADGRPRPRPPRTRAASTRRTRRARAALEAAVAWHRRRRRRRAGPRSASACSPRIDAADGVAERRPTTRRHPRRRPLPPRSTRRGVRPRRPRPPRRPTTGDTDTADDLSATSGPADGGRLALHHRTRSHRRPTVILVPWHVSRSSGSE